MTEEQSGLLLKSRESISAAKLLVTGGYPEFAVVRAYYAMFYIAEAFLEGESLSFSKHSAVIAAFGREFAHTGKVPVEFHRFLMEAQEMRHTCDYDVECGVTLEQAKEQIKRAEDFLTLAESLIGPTPPATNEPH
ncbi:MAG: HEPN domain-containing protein [Nitrospirae bacterium]|nr:HEPN domain-containing protein [Nitrospirota bacterium]